MSRPGKRPVRHVARCVRCGLVLNHGLMRCVRDKRTGRKIHFCPRCQR